MKITFFKRSPIRWEDVASFSAELGEGVGRIQEYQKARYALAGLSLFLTLIMQGVMGMVANGIVTYSSAFMKSTVIMVFACSFAGLAVSLLVGSQGLNQNPKRKKEFWFMRALVAIHVVMVMTNISYTLQATPLVSDAVMVPIQVALFTTWVAFILSKWICSLLLAKLGLASVELYQDSLEMELSDEKSLLSQHCRGIEVALKEAAVLEKISQHGPDHERATTKRIRL